MYTFNRPIMILVGLALTLAGCSNRVTKCSIETLLLDHNLFPEGTHAEPLESPLPEYPKESAAQTFYYAPDAVFHEVINWKSARAAKNEYTLRVKSAFDVDKYMGPWETLDDLYISSIAQNYHVACGIDGNLYQCRMVATYDEYFVFFRAYVSDQGITLPNVNELIQAIDERMAQCIDQK